MSNNLFYSGMHWSERNREAKRVHALVKFSIKPEKRKIIDGKVNIYITAYFNKRPFDSSNICAKLYEDGLKGVILKDDSHKYVGFIGTKSELDRENPRVEIEIKEI